MDRSLVEGEGEGVSGAGQTDASAVAEALEQKEETLEEVLSRHRLASFARLPSLFNCLFCGLDDAGIHALSLCCQYIRYALV